MDKESNENIPLNQLSGLSDEILNIKLNTLQNENWISESFGEDNNLIVHQYIISCREFLSLTDGEQFIEVAGKFDVQLFPEWEDAIFLQVDFETGEVLGHEGRHRVAALLNSGYTHTYIVVELTSKTFIREMFENLDLEKISNFAKNCEAKMPKKLFKGSL